MRYGVFFYQHRVSIGGALLTYVLPSRPSLYSQLTMNVKKTKYVFFGMKSKTRKIGNHSLLIDNNRLGRVTSYKYLGLTLDMNLNYNNHLENCLKLISHKTYLLSKIRII